MSSKSMNETLLGMRNVEREISDQIRERQGQLPSFAWNYGRGSQAEFPDPVHLEVRVGSKRISADWSHLWLQDSAAKPIDHMWMRQEIERIVDEFVPQP